MRSIYAEKSVSISELKKSPSSVIKKAGKEAIAVLNHNVPNAYIVPSETYEKLMRLLNDCILGKNGEKTVGKHLISIQDLLGEL
jgi:antitoxin StbD